MLHSKLPLSFLHRGKVRDMYEVDAEHLLIVTTDRISAFDVVLPDPIPEKGAILTRVSGFWMDRLKEIVPNHLVDKPLESILSAEDCAALGGRAIIVRRLEPVKIEAIVRGYLIGSGWKDYQQTGSVCGLTLPQGLGLADQLPEPLYTPSSKAPAGEHDENISFEDSVALLGEPLAAKIRDISLTLYKTAAEYALKRGIIIADTKFEFGLDADQKLYLIDEALTPDSSRFWPADQYQPGKNPPSFDKQFVRDYLATLDWNKTAPGPALPPEVIAKTAEKYAEVEGILTAG